MLIVKLPGDKPKSCDECEFLNKIHNCMILHKNVRYDDLPYDSRVDRDPACPLVEVDEKIFRTGYCE